MGCLAIHDAARLEPLLMEVPPQLFHPESLLLFNLRCSLWLKARKDICKQASPGSFDFAP
jgi:hypothetical protein